ncbi:MAG: DNA-3-methyladenine glycosylase [Candidatus Nitrosocaldus sp.]|nr:DNA-3-methyladenine glycosylase [Candidatus Nitrosocaldus sp.]MDW8275558.1 DNA-3-methyladenine glycosylase [Candidatus Nitrosocaldus sp.]
MVLARGFYSRDTLEVARDLLGRMLVRVMDGIVLSGMIVEVEAYTRDDPASHAYRGMTARNRVMFGEVGHAYVYFIYGKHYCLNIVARSRDVEAGAVLIRAVEPVEGVEVMMERRGNGLKSRMRLEMLTSGPGRLTEALGIDARHNGLDLTVGGELYVEEGYSISDDMVETTSRVGVVKGADRPWRFIIKGNRFVSRVRV